MFKFTIKLKFAMSVRPAKKRRKATARKCKHQQTGFLNFIDNETMRLRKRRRPSTCDNYMTARRSLGMFLNGNDIDIGSVTRELIEEYSRWLASRNVCDNTISCYMRSLRSIYNIATKRYRLKHHDPFDTVFTGNGRTHKRALETGDMKKLQNAPTSGDTFLPLARDIFLFSFYAMGMPFADIASLKKTQISNGILTYRRLKTGREVKVGIEPCMEKIIRKYSCSDSEYVFPLRDSTGNLPRQLYNRTLHRYNMALKKLAARTGIRCNLTSYVARHTWASLAYSHNVPLHVISQALGHATPRTTLIYIKEIDEKTIVQANKKILNKIGL